MNLLSCASCRTPVVAGRPCPGCGSRATGSSAAAALLGLVATQVIACQEVHYGVPASLAGTPLPDLVVTPASLELGVVDVGSTGVGELEVLNYGESRLALESAGLEPGSGPFTAAPDAPVPTTLDPGEVLVFTVTFAPEAAGPAAARLHLESDDPDEPVVDVDLAGEGR